MKMEYDGRMDLQSINLCNAINRIEGLYTTDSCCGHNGAPYRIFFKVNNLKKLPVLLYYIVG